MKNTKTKVVAVLLLFWAMIACAQLVTNVTGTEVTKDDEAVRAYLTKYSWVKIFIVPATVLLVMLVRKIVPVIPNQIWPWVVPILGVGLDYVGSKFGFWTGSLEAGGLMGGLAVWLHQLGTQTKNIVQEGPSTDAKTATTVNFK
jgi:hypothetical protein